MFAMAALSVALLSGCSSQDEETQVAVNDVVYTAVVENNGTRAYNADGKGTFNWSEGDNITAYDGSAFQEMTMASGAGTAEATYVSPSWIPREVAVFPISALKSYSGGVLTVNYPTTHAIASGQAIETANVDDPLVAYFKAGTKRFDFLHLGGVMEFETVLPTGATSFTVTLDKGVTGDFVVNDADKTNPTVEAAESDGSNNTVTFTFDPVSEDNGYMVFLLPVPTGTYGSMTVTASDGTNETTLTNTMENTVKRCDWLKFTLNMGEYTGVIEKGNEVVSTAEAFEQAVANGKTDIQLDADITVSNSLAIGDKKNIDLNKHTLNANGGIEITTENPVTISNGSLDLGNGTLWLNNKNDVTLDNVTLTSNSSGQGGYTICVGDDGSGGSGHKYSDSKLTIKNSTIENTYSTGICIFNKHTLTIENTTIKHNWFGITQNGNIPGSSISLKNVNIEGPYSGIYLSNKADGDTNTLTIDGGTITSNEESALEVKKTNITVKNATLVSKATKQSYSVSGGGSNAVGYGIALVGYKTGTAYEGTTSFSNNQFQLSAGTDAIKIGKYDGTSLVKVE